MPDRINKTVVILRTFFSFICPQHFMPVNRPSSAKGIRSRVVWQCNSKFKDKTRCKTPHLTEDEVKAAFIRLVNKLSTDREFYITELTAIKDRLGDTTALEKERRILDEQLGIDAKAVNDLIAQNARVAQNQTEYNERYDALVSRYEETERRRDEVADRINQIMVRRRKLERFIETVEVLPELYTEFDAGQWAALVDRMTVHAKDRDHLHPDLRDGDRDLKTNRALLDHYDLAGLFCLCVG